MPLPRPQKVQSMLEMFGASVAEKAGKVNEDAFLVSHSPAFAVLCDGAGAAGGCAKRVIGLFEKLFREGSEEAGKPETWGRWIKLLDSSLLGTTQSTFLAVAASGDEIVGACAGDSRAYIVDRNGELRFLSEGASKQRLGSGVATAFPFKHALRPGETLLLLSDGVWTVLNGYALRMAVVVARARNFADMPTLLIERASKTGRTDDMTVVCLRTR